MKKVLGWVLIFLILFPMIAGLALMLYAYGVPVWEIAIGYGCALVALFLITLIVWIAIKFEL